MHKIKIIPRSQDIDSKILNCQENSSMLSTNEKSAVVCVVIHLTSAYLYGEISQYINII